MRQILALFLTLALLLSSCAQEGGHRQEEGLAVACTTYPVYLMTQAVLEGTDAITPSLLIQEQVSCLHNYTLTIRDMKAIEGADLIAISGAGLEEFLSDALEGRATVDCSQGVPLLEGETEEEEHDHHDHDHEEGDPHYWLDPDNAAIMVRNLAEAFSRLDPEHAERYRFNAEAAAEELTVLKERLLAAIPQDCPRALITFHDGFGYFAQAMGFTVVASVEEEEGSEASARRIRELVALIDQYHLPAVFVEANGSDTAARCLAQERGSRIGVLTMGMSAQDTSLTGTAAYAALLEANLNAILEVYA